MMQAFFTHPQNAHFGAAECAGYNPTQQGLIDLTPSDDDLAMSTSFQPKQQAITRSAFGTASFASTFHQFGQQFGRLSSFMFTGLASIPSAPPAPTELTSTRAPRATLKKFCNPNLRATTITEVHAIKRKHSEEESKPPIKKYKVSPELDSLMHTDMNTNSYTYAQTRRPKQHSWGTSKLRRAFRGVKSYLGASRQRGGRMMTETETRGDGVFLHDLSGFVIVERPSEYNCIRYDSLAA